MSRPLVILTVITALCGIMLQAQEKPLTASGTISTGFYSSYDRGGVNADHKITFVPFGGKCDLNGYYRSPDLIGYWMQPEFNAGPQASDAGILGGNGIRMRVVMLRRSAFPLTFRFSNVQFQDVYFGSLSQVSSYTRSNHNKDLGLTTELRRGRSATATIDWGTGSTRSESGIDMIPDYAADSRHLNVDAKYERWGWNFEGFARAQQQTSSVLSIDAAGAHGSLLRQSVHQYQVSAGRRFLRDSELYADAGSQSTSTRMLGTPIDLTTQHASVNLRLFQKRRWKTLLRTGYTSNLSSLLMTRWVNDLSINGAVAPDSTLLVPFQNTISFLNLNGLTTADLSHGLAAYGSLDRSEVLAASNSSLSSQYTTVGGGMTYARSFSWGSVSGQYGGTLGSGSVTGQTGRIRGTNYVFSAQHGKRDGFLFDVSVRGTDQSVHNEQPAHENSFASDANVEVPLFGRLRAHAGGGRHRSTFTNAGTDFDNDGFNAQAGLNHPRFQLAGTVNSSAGTSLPPLGRLLGDLGIGSALLIPPRLARSDYRGTTFSLHSNPMRRMELSALWTRSVQHLEGVVANDFEILDVQLTFHFRKLQLVAGTFRSSQLFSSYLATYPAIQRGRYYFRVSRAMRFL